MSSELRGEEGRQKVDGDRRAPSIEVRKLNAIGERVPPRAEVATVAIDPPAAARSTRLRRRLERALVAAAMVFTLWFYYTTVRLNNGFEDWGDMDYYKLLVRGWRKGQLSLDKDPHPKLLLLADPYDPAQNGPWKMGDATLYRGKYYIYFGPAPALTLMLPYAVLTGRELTMGGATFVFTSLAFVVASGLWLALRRRYFPGSSLLLAPLGVLAIGFGTHLLSLAQRPMFWELAISGGIAFTMLATAAAYWAVHGRRPLLAMAAAGLCLGLAVASRPTCLFAAPVLLVPVLHAWREGRARRDASAAAWWKLWLAAALPLGACGLAIMAHNYARFENPLEWGQNYQLSGAYEGRLTHFSHRYLPRNVAVYFFQPLRWESEFPFALAEGREDWSHIEGYMGTEEVSGLMVTFPFLWFVLGLPLAWRRREAAESRQLSASLGCVAAYAIPVGLLVLSYFSTTMRYESDFAVAFALLALTGLLALERQALATGRRRLRLVGGRILAASATLLCLVTVLVGVLVSFDYHGRSMAVMSTAQWRELTASTHRVVANVGRWLGRVEGPRELKVRFKPQPPGTVETFWHATDPRAAERILVEHIGDHLIRFGFVRGGDAPQWGRPLRWDDNHTHTVHVQLPSLYPKLGAGWWSGVRRAQEFRERTAVAVWFSGGRALEAVAPLLPEPLAPGGAVSREFTGEIRKLSNRLFRDDEISTGYLHPHAPRGGVLRMHVVFPRPLREKGEPLFATGAHFQSNILFVQPAAGGRVQIVYETYGVPRVETPPFEPNPRGHMIEFEMASFRPDDFGREGRGDVVVRLDGREVIRTLQDAHNFPWGDEAIGRNPFGTTCELDFRGWIREVEWLNSRRNPDAR